MRQKRSRTRSSGIPTFGHSELWLYQNGAWAKSTSTNRRGPAVYSESITDYYLPPYTDSSLTVKKVKVISPRLSGNGDTYLGTAQIRCFDAALPLPLNAASGESKQTYDPPLPDWDMWASAAMNNANPNLPDVDLPVFLFELRELPSLIANGVRLIDRYGLDKDALPYYVAIKKALASANPDDLRQVYNDFRKRAGSIGDMLRDLAGGNLAYQFGWAPFLSDIETLAGFSNLIDERVKEIRELEKRNKLHRQLGEKSRAYTIWDHSNYAWSGYGVSFRALPLTVMYTETYWYTMKFKLLTEFGTMPPAEQRVLARKIALGLEVNASAVWNAIPWSWLIDWCSNVGDVLNQTRNLLDYEWSDLNIMAHATYEAPIPYSVTPARLRATCTDGEVGYERKLRHVRPTPYALLSFQLPLLTLRQVGILSSLWVTRGASSAPYVYTD